MNINQETVDLVKIYEGLRLKSYRDPVGVWTIGYGTTTNAGIGVSVGAGMTITEEKAQEYLRKALEKFSDDIIPLFKVKPTDNQFGAMLSLSYNIGPSAFARSTCLKRFNAGDIDGAAEALTWFNKAGGKVLRGLVRRRAAERELFLSDQVSEVITPTADPEQGVAKSTTLQAVGATAVAGGTAAVTAVGSLDPSAQKIVVVCACVAALGLLWVARERLKKWAGGDR